MTKSWPLLALALLGAVAATFCLAAFDWTTWACRLPAAEEGKVLTPGFGGCVEFWLNRYQTLIGAAVALLAGWLALVGALGQIKVASQQAAAVRADRIASLLAVTIEFATCITDVFDEMFIVDGAIRQTMRPLGLDRGIDAAMIAEDFAEDVAEEINGQIVELKVRANRLTDLCQNLKRARSAAQINPMLRNAFRCSSELIYLSSHISAQVRAIETAFNGPRDASSFHYRYVLQQRMNWSDVNNVTNAARAEMELSTDKLQTQLNATTVKIIST